MKALYLIAVLAAAGCSSNRPPTSADTAKRSAEAAAPSVTPEELTAPEGHLVLRPLTLKEHGQPSLVLDQDGTLRAVKGQRALGRLERDGRFVDPNGQLVAQLTADGEILDGKGEYLPVTIDAAGTIKLLTENRTVRLLDDGTLEGGNAAAAITIDGATPETRRAAMFVLVLSGYQVRSRS